MENYSKNAFIPIFKIKKSIKKNLQLQIAITFLKITFQTMEVRAYIEEKAYLKISDCNLPGVAQWTEHWPMKLWSLV